MLRSVPESAVRVRDLVVRYGARTAVAGLSFEAPTGQVTALVGPNGAGKTSTVEVCVGLRPRAGGTVEVLGRAVSHRTAAPDPRIGVMLQDGGLYSTARPLELVRYIASLYPDPDDPATLLEGLGIDPRTRTTIRRLSGGEQQRVKTRGRPRRPARARLPGRADRRPRRRSAAAPSTTSSARSSTTAPRSS